MSWGLLVRTLPILAALGAISIALAGCSNSSGNGGGEEISPVPIQQLQGRWRLVNRAENCNSSITVFGGAGLYRVYAEKRPVKKYFDVRQFVIGGGTVTVVAENFAFEPAGPVKITFSVENDRLRLKDMSTVDGVSYSKPPDNQPPEAAAHMSTVFALSQNLLAMDRCPAPPPET